jgi:rare lipoprotein A
MFAAIVAAAFIWSIPTAIINSEAHSRPMHRPIKFSGIASWYGVNDDTHGHLTASGEIFNRDRFTCASRSLPFGAMLRVTNKRNGKSCVVRVTDRGPIIKSRIIDLAYAAAKHIGLTGIGEVQIEVLSKERV